ncbi:hypothetical protein PFISCL1PPCAC_1650, partial [Pristionchus fissidentatus]
TSISSVFFLYQSRHFVVFFPVIPSILGFSSCFFSLHSFGYNYREGHIAVVAVVAYVCTLNGWGQSHAFRMSKPPVITLSIQFKFLLVVSYEVE